MAIVNCFECDGCGKLIFATEDGFLPRKKDRVVFILRDTEACELPVDFHYCRECAKELILSGEYGIAPSAGYDGCLGMLFKIKKGSVE